MASDKLCAPKWVAQRPSAFDIVAGYFPETKPKGELRLRPCLILDVLQGKESEKIACRIAYGTKNLRLFQRRHLDLIIQNAADLEELRLPVATRFVLDPDQIEIMPWTERFFGCWSGYEHPKISALSEKYAKEYAYIMMQRRGS